MMKMEKKEKMKWCLIFALSILAVILADQVTKYLAIKKLTDRGAFILIKDVLELQLFFNDGIAWSMLSGQTVFILFTGIVFLVVILFVIFKLPTAKKYHCLYILCGLLCGGAVGNMIDRIRFGYVVDFISFVLIHFPVFNVADSFIVVSIICLAFLFLFIYKDEDLSFLDFKQKKYREVK